MIMSSHGDRNNMFFKRISKNSQPVLFWPVKGASKIIKPYKFREAWQLSLSSNDLFINERSAPPTNLSTSSVAGSWTAQCRPRPVKVCFVNLWDKQTVPVTRPVSMKPLLYQRSPTEGSIRFANSSNCADSSLALPIGNKRGQIATTGKRR